MPGVEGAGGAEVAIDGHADTGVEGQPEEVAEDYVYCGAGAGEEGVSKAAAGKAGGVCMQGALKVAHVGYRAQTGPVEGEEGEGVVGRYPALEWRYGHLRGKFAGGAHAARHYRHISFCKDAVPDGRLESGGEAQAVGFHDAGQVAVGIEVGIGGKNLAYAGSAAPACF